MSFLTKVITTVFGNKSEKDLKKIKPYVDKVNSIYSNLEPLSDLELKEKFNDHKKAIEGVRDDARKIAESENLSFAETENHIYKSEQGYLDDNMCEVFAIIKDASRRIVVQSIRLWIKILNGIWFIMMSN